jgi:hypothetical protein
MVTMSEIYRFTVLRRPASLKPEGVELFSGDADVLAPADGGSEWSLSRVPRYQFLQQLEATNEPLTTDANVRPLIEALGQRPAQHLDAQKKQLQELVRDSADVRDIKAGLGAVTRFALAAHPAPIADLLTLTRSVVAMQTLSEWADQTRRDEDWQSGRARLMLRPPPAPARQARREVRGAKATGVSSPSSLRDRVVAGARTSWQEIAGLATFASGHTATSDSSTAPVNEPQVAPNPSLLEPVGRQDLIVARTRHLGYRLAELSRIENIAPGETRDRRHRVETEASSEFFEEVEHEEETTESLATTTRDELRTEIATESSRELNLTGTVRTSYRGPVNVDVEATAEFNQQSGVQTTAARAHAVDIVDEASTTVRDRVLRRNVHRFRRLLAEKNRHQFQNLTSDGHVAQYYWLEKVQRVALFNYGKRMMYEFVIPEPASYLRALGTEAPPAQSSVPAPPTEYYTDILAMDLQLIEDEFLSGDLTKSFEITVGERPKQTWIEAQLFEEMPGEGDDQFSAAVADIAIPAGHEGIRVLISVQTATEDKSILPHLTLSLDELKVHVQARTLDNAIGTDDSGNPNVGNQQYVWDDNPHHTMSMSERVFVAELDVLAEKGDPLVEGTHKVGLLIENFNMYSVNVGVLVSPTATTVEDYQRSILAAVVSDYRRQYENYAAQALASPSTGPTLVENLSDAQETELRQIERDEVKRAALSVIRNADPGGYNPIDGVDGVTPDGVTPNVSGWFRDHRPMADEIVFLEQAFEWEHMNFVLYGYQWADTDELPVQIFGVRGGDRPFREFLKAGAARVQLPVRPGFAGFVDDFMMEGNVWSGGPPPQMGSPGYVDFITEQSIQLGAPGDEQPQTEKVPDGQHRPIVWDVVTPTDLVMLKVWADGDQPPLERMIPPSLDSLTVAADVVCEDPLANWRSGTGTVPDDPSA